MVRKALSISLALMILAMNTICVHSFSAMENSSMENSSMFMPTAQAMAMSTSQNCGQQDGNTMSCCFDSHSNRSTALNVLQAKKMAVDFVPVVHCFIYHNFHNTFDRASQSSFEKPIGSTSPPSLPGIVVKKE